MVSFTQKTAVGALALAAGARAANHIVAVGSDSEIRFMPNVTMAAVGDTIEFQFFAGTGPHSVVTTTFDSPCHPDTSSAFSDYIEGTTSGNQTWTYTVASSDPIWYYCSAKSHCEGGMVGVINPLANETVEAFAAAAKSVQVNEAPSSATGGVASTGGMATATSAGAMSTSKTSGSATTTATSSSGTASASASPSSKTNGAGALEAGAKVGLVAAGLAALLI